MTYKISFRQMPLYVRITTAGSPSADDFEKLLLEVTGSEKWVKGTPQMIDHRALDMGGLDNSVMLNIVDTVERHRNSLGAGRCAFVVKDEVGFGFARMYDMTGGDTIHQEIRVFYSIREADSWLKKKQL